MKRKTLGASLLAWILTNKLMAGIGLILAITVLVIAGIIIYCLVNLCKQVLGGSSGNNNTNNVSGQSSYQITYYGAQTNLLGEVFGAINPYTYYSTLNESQAQAVSVLQNGFALQYGLDGLSHPWCHAGTNLVNQVEQTEVLTNTAGNYTLAETVMGITTIISANTNTSDCGIYQNAVNDTTDADGDAFWVITNQPCNVVIWRSTNLLSWSPVFTNTVLAGAVQNYTDTNTFKEAFYTVVITK
jgi:hypothetical protein